jgi:hypothetical protein
MLQNGDAIINMGNIAAAAAAGAAIEATTTDPITGLPTAKTAPKLLTKKNDLMSMSDR